MMMMMMMMKALRAVIAASIGRRFLPSVHHRLRRLSIDAVGSQGQLSSMVQNVIALLPVPA